MEKSKKGSSYVGFAIISIILGAILISIGSFIKNNLNKADSELIEVTAKISSYEQADGDKINVICKYGFEGNEYTYICHTAKKDEANSKYKIGTEKTIKINKSEPGRITILDLTYVIMAIYTIGLIFFFLAIIYMISEIVRLAKRSKMFNDVNEGNN